MEFEILKKDNRKKWIIGAVVVLAIALTIFFVSTRANYKTTDKLNLINTTVNYSPSDLNIMAIKVENSTGGYDNASTVPASGYTLSDKSYCEVNGNKDTSIQIEYKDGKVKIGVSQKGTKCYLFFDKPKVSDIILANKTIEERTDFSTTITTNTTGKIYKTQDDDGDTYYFAGAVDNNWVQFGTENGNPIYWRIIRINGDGTIRLIYNGTSMVQTGTSTQINGTTYKFPHKNAYYSSSTVNAYIKDNVYVGYMYGTAGSSAYEATHANTNSSYAKQIVDEWYNTNLNKTGVKEKISINTGFCGDRTSNTSDSAAPNGSGGYGTTATYYGASYRLSVNKVPSLRCTNTNDLYTVSNANKGNKALTYPVGLITADEVAYAGGAGAGSNDSYYLYTNQWYWTMTPYIYNGSAYVFIVLSGGILGNSGLGNARGIRPVINLKADTQFSADGDGTTAHPYIVV